MIGLVKNELRLWFSKKNIGLMFLSLLAIYMILVSYDKDYQNYDQEVIRLMDNEVLITQNIIEEYEAEIKELEKHDPGNIGIKGLSTILDIWKNENQYASMMKTLITNNENQRYDTDILALQAKMDENAKLFVTLGVQPDSQNIYRYSYQDLMERIELREIYHQHNILPKVNPYTPDGAYILHDVLSGEGIAMMLLLTIITLLNFNIWSYDFEAQAYRLLFTQPYSKHKIYATRCLMNLVLNFLFIGCFLLILFVIASMRYGIGGNDFVGVQKGVFDIGVYLTDENTRGYYQMKALLPIQFIQIVCYLVCYLTSIQMISFFSKKSEISFLVVCVLLAFSVSSIQSEIIPLIGYFQTLKVLNGTFDITFLFSITVLLILSFLFYASGYFVLKKRDFLK